MQAAVRREQLLSTALQLFREQGYAATTTKKIAEVAGVTEGLVFHYFGTKDALLLEIMARRNTFAGRVLMLVQRASAGTARELFGAIAEGYGEVSAEERDFIAFASVEAAVNPALRAPVTEGTRVVIASFVALLEGRVKAGELRPDAELHAAALGFFGGFQFFFAQHRELGAAAWRKEAAAFASAWADVAWRGIATAAAQAEADSLSDSSTKMPSLENRSPTQPSPKPRRNA